MKLLLLSTSSSRNAGGLYNSVRNLGQQIHYTNSFETAVMAFHDEFSDRDKEAYHPLKLIEYSIVGPKGVAFTKDLYQKIEDFKPDIVHAQGIWLYTSRINTEYCIKNKIPYLISPRGMLDPWILSVRSWKKKLGLYLYERRHLENATCLHALCKPEYEAIRKFGYKKPIAIVPNGVFLPKETSYPTQDSLPSWKKNDERKIILFISRIHPKKGLDNLIEAWGKIQPTDWKLVIAGQSHNDEYQTKLNNLVIENNVKDSIEFIGPQFHKDKDLCFRVASAFILPSFSEGMPMAVLEAWSYGIPTVITDDCNLEEGFQSNAAFRIETDPNTMASQLKVFLGYNEETRTKMGQNGLALINEKFTWQAIEQEMVNIYNWCLNKELPLPKSIKLD